MRPAGRLALAADLRCEVVAPDGTRGSVSLTGDGTGPLVLTVTDARVVWRSLPTARVTGGPVRGAWRAVVGAVPPEVREDVLAVPVDVVVDGRRVASWRGGRWRPSPRTALAVGATVLGAVGTVALLLGLAGVAAARALARRRPHRGAAGLTG